MAKYGYFWAQNGHKWAIWAKSGALTVEHCSTKYIQQVLLRVSAVCNIFLTPPPLTHSVTTLQLAIEAFAVSAASYH